jgi:hypothetical protein
MLLWSRDFGNFTVRRRPSRNPIERFKSQASARRLALTGKDVNRESRRRVHKVAFLRPGLRPACDRQPVELRLRELTFGPRIDAQQSGYLKVPEVVFVAGPNDDVVGASVEAVDWTGKTTGKSAATASAMRGTIIA